MRKYLSRILSGIGLCLLLVACDGDTRNRRAERGENFVSDPDHLYFMNTRSRDYLSTTVEEGVEVFRYDDLDGDPDLLIRNNWLDDRADLILEGRILSLVEVRRLRDQLRGGQDSLELATNAQREAVTEVIADYLRLVGD
ncbi:MAG: hypothetical protein WA952_18545 [Lewinella sp.]